MFKNQTPRQLSFYIALTSASVVVVLFFLLEITGLFRISWAQIVAVFLLVFIVSFVANFYLIRYYIFRRIKLIYKIIHRQKLPSDFKAGKIAMSKNILDEVEREVDEWAEQHNEDFEELERLA